MTAIEEDRPTASGTQLDLIRRCLSGDLLALLDHAQASDRPEFVAACLAALRDLKQDAATVYADVEKHLLDCMPDRRLEVPGLGLVESHKRTKRTGWDHDALARAVLLAAPGPADMTPDRVYQELKRAFSFGAGKVTRLRELGLQPDEFCREDEDGWSVQLPPRDLATVDTGGAE